MSRTDGTPLIQEERERLAVHIGQWELRPCPNRRLKNDSAEYCERVNCQEWYSPVTGETMLAAINVPTVDMDGALAWLKGQDRAIVISGGTPGHWWQVRIKRPGQYGEHVLFSRSRNAPRLEDAVLRAAYDVMMGAIP